jgi:hypothetical protein
MAKVDNRGLDEPINKLAGIVNRYRNQLTRADVWMLAAIEAASVLQKGGAVDFEFNFVGRASCLNLLAESSLPCQAHIWQLKAFSTSLIMSSVSLHLRQWRFLEHIPCESNVIASTYAF